MEEKREGREHFKQFNLASYVKKNFGMFGGEEVNVNVAQSAVSSSAGCLHSELV